MSFNRAKYEYFFPLKVYRCVCLASVIEKCCDDGNYALTEIVDELNNYSFFDQDRNKIFSVKCGEQNRDCIFVCENHLAVVLFAKKKFSCTDTPSSVNATISYSCGKKDTFCTGCIKHYLTSMYHYFYFVNFDLKCS